MAILPFPGANFLNEMVVRVIKNTYKSQSIVIFIIIIKLNNWVWWIENPTNYSFKGLRWSIDKLCAKCNKM